MPAELLGYLTQGEMQDQTEHLSIKFMLKKLIYTTFSIIALSGSASASVIFSDTFDTYTAGNLVGQGPYVQQGTSAVTPVQVTAVTGGNVVTLNSSGQDVAGAFTSQIPVDGGSIYFSMSLNVSAAQATGDYFFANNTTATSTNNSDRVFAKSTTGGYLLGFVNSASGTTTYGTTVLTLGMTYQFIVAHNFVAGTLNDTFNLYINPTNATESSNTPYLAATFGGTTAEPTAYGAVLLRQGAAGSAPTLTIDNLNVSNTFGDSTGLGAIPEPSTYIACGVGLAILLVPRLKRRHVE